MSHSVAPAGNLTVTMPPANMLSRRPGVQWHGRGGLTGSRLRLSESRVTVAAAATAGLPTGGPEKLLSLWVSS